MLGKSQEKMKREGRGALDGALESSALFRDCARRRGRLRIPGPTAYVLGKVLKTGDRHEAGTLFVFVRWMLTKASFRRTTVQKQIRDLHASP